jgi:hypothetical protein
MEGLPPGLAMKASTFCEVDSGVVGGDGWVGENMH